MAMTFMELLAQSGQVGLLDTGLFSPSAFLLFLPSLIDSVCAWHVCNSMRLPGFFPFEGTHGNPIIGCLFSLIIISEFPSTAGAGLAMVNDRPQYGDAIIPKHIMMKNRIA
jgi:hypothetical protein